MRISRLLSHAINSAFYLCVILVLYLNNSGLNGCVIDYLTGLSAAPIIIDTPHDKSKFVLGGVGSGGGNNNDDDTSSSPFAAPPSSSSPFAIPPSRSSSPYAIPPSSSPAATSSSSPNILSKSLPSPAANFLLLKSKPRGLLERRGSNQSLTLNIRYHFSLC